MKSGRQLLSMRPHPTLRSISPAAPSRSAPHLTSDVTSPRTLGGRDWCLGGNGKIGIVVMLLCLKMKQQISTVLEIVKLETRYNTSINKPVYILCMFVRKYVLHIDTRAEQFL